MQHETSVALPMTAPPNLSIKVPKSRDLPKKSKPWSNVQLPVDILLLTVEECEFLACYGYMRNSFRSYHDDFGSVYIGNMGEDEVKPLKIALMRCLKGSSGPCGSQTIVKNAVVRLRPKVVYSVGCCIGLNQENTEIGDVVISSNLTTEDFRTPVGRKIANLIRSAADGWEPPLESPQARDVHVHCDGEILCGVNVHQDTVKRHQQLYPRAVAMEMEGKGIFVASHDLKIEWVIVKGVSDLADGNRISDESWRYFACVMAASVVSHMLSDSIVFKQWPHYHDPSSGSEKIPTVEYLVGQQSATVTKDTVCTFLSEKQPCLDDEKNVSRTDWEDGPSSRQSDRKRRSQSGSTPESGSRKRSVWSGSTFDVTDTFLRILVEFTGRDVSDEKKDYLYNILGTAGGQYVKSHNLTPELERVGAYFQHLEDQYNLNLVSIGEGSLEIIVHCPTLESLEHLWSDYLSGHLSEVAERYLVTDEIKRKLDLDTVRLKTTIAKKNYLMCRKALVEMSEESAAESLKSVCKPRLKRSVSETKKDAVASSKESNPRRSRSFSEFTFSQEPSHVSGKTSNEEFLFEKQSRADTPDEAGAPHLGHRSLIPEEKKTFRKEEDGPSCSDAKTLQTVSKQDTPVSTSETGTDTITLQLKITPEDLNEEQQEIFDDVIQQTVCSMEPDDLSTDEGVGSLTKYLKESRHSLTLKTFTSDGLTIIVQCPVESLESLLVDCHSGHLNKVAERCLLTDKIRTILNMDTVRLKTTIEEEPSNVGMLKAAHPQTEPGQDVSTRWAETGGVESNAGFPSQRPEQDQGAGARWTEPGQGAHGSHTAAQLIKREPDHRTNTSWTNSSSEILLKTERRCPIAQLLLKNNARPSCRKPFSRTPLHLACRYGQESVVRLLLEHGANVNAIDRFQRAPLQKAERHSHQSIAQLLLKNNAKPSCRQPGKMKETSCTVRAERAKSSRTALHKASISGQFETVKILLDSGEDVDQRDQVSFSFYLGRTKKGRYCVFPSYCHRLLKRGCMIALSLFANYLLTNKIVN